MAPSHGLTPDGAKLLLEMILEEPKEIVNRSGKVIEETQNTSAEPLPCN